MEETPTRPLGDQKVGAGPVRTPAGQRHTLTKFAGRPRSTNSDRIPITLVALAVALNQSGVIFGINLSLADPLALILIASAALSKQLWIPTGALLYFLALSVTVLTTATFLLPVWIGTSLEPVMILRDYVKLVVSFGFFILGVRAVRTQEHEWVFKGFVGGACTISLLAPLSLLLPALYTVPQLHYAGFRFRGLMNDPNYFSVIAVCALAILWTMRFHLSGLRWLATLVLVTAILLSGSKTGAIALAAWLLWRLLQLMRNKWHDASIESILGYLLGVCVLIGVVTALADPNFTDNLRAALTEVPALERIAPLLLDFDQSLQGGGSLRDAVWQNAITVITVSPIVGVGVGTYQQVAHLLTGTETLAHNTFLQLSAEWGLPLVVIFFSWLVVVLIRKPWNTEYEGAWRTGRDALVVLLVGSMGISLNNARIFWFLLGLTAAAAFPPKISTTLAPAALKE